MKNRFAIIGPAVLIVLVLTTFACVSKSTVPATPITPSATRAPASTVPAATAPSPVSFQGKTITIISSSVAGSSTDIIARVYSRHLPRFLPGTPNAVVRNMPGGAHTIAGNYIYRAKPDGLTLLTAAGTVQVNQILGLKAAQYDVLKMTFLVSYVSNIVYYAKSAVVPTRKDIVTAKGLVYGFSPGSLGMGFILVKEFMNIPTEKIALGYAGGGEARRGFLTGEINLTNESAAGYFESVVPLVKSGEVIPLFASGLIDEKGNLARDPVLRDIPTAQEVYEEIYGRSPSGMAWEAYKAMITAGVHNIHALYLPPGTPDSIVSAYRTAVERMVKDAEFRKPSDSLMGKDTIIQVGEVGQKALKQGMTMDPKVVTWLRDFLPRYGIAIE
ncbi:MAG: hypothetical protein HYX90_08035 [Chloroflexi bacterium]|nr:hypothetical protein [Chloroflexota bacterium]